MVTHIRHGITKNSNGWLLLGNENTNWYIKYGQFKALCWNKGEVKTSDKIEDVTCQKCLKQFTGYKI